METNQIYLERVINDRSYRSHFFIHINPKKLPDPDNRQPQAEGEKSYTYPELISAFTRLPAGRYELVRNSTFGFSLESADLDGLDSVLGLVNKITTAVETLKK